MFDLTDLGLGPDVQDNFNALNDPSLVLGRVLTSERRRQTLGTAAGPLPSVSAGRLRTEAEQPAVGDWVACRREAGSLQTIAVLPRSSVLQRAAVGAPSGVQTIAANLDRVFIVTAVGADFSPRRLERYLSVVSQGGAAPVIVVTKTDLPHDPVALICALDEVATGVPVAFVSSTEQGGLQALDPYLVAGETIALVGSSGVGKSTLINTLMGSSQQTTRSVRDGDDKGRHTTTRRELVALEQGSLLIDTPGMRALGVSAEASTVQDVFGEIHTLAQGCRFSDCGHDSEPGCAVQQALQDGSLSQARWRSMQRLLKEAAYEKRRAEEGLQYDTKNRWKQIHQQIRARKKVDPKLQDR